MAQLTTVLSICRGAKTFLSDSSKRGRFFTIDYYVHHVNAPLQIDKWVFCCFSDLIFKWISIFPRIAAVDACHCVPIHRMTLSLVHQFTNSFFSYFRRPSFSNQALPHGNSPNRTINILVNTRVIVAFRWWHTKGN